MRWPSGSLYHSCLVLISFSCLLYMRYLYSSIHTSATLRLFLKMLSGLMLYGDQERKTCPTWEQGIISILLAEVFISGGHIQALKLSSKFSPPQIFIPRNGITIIFIYVNFPCFLYCLKINYLLNYEILFSPTKAKLCRIAIHYVQHVIYVRTFVRPESTTGYNAT